MRRLLDALAALAALTLGFALVGLSWWSPSL